MLVRLALTTLVALHSMLALGACSTPHVQPARAALPLALEREMREIEVVMFMTDWCPHCTRARDWLERGDYNFIELDIERDERAAALLQTLNPRGSVPLFDVEGQILVGFDPPMLRAAMLRAVERRSGAGQLDFAGLGRSTVRPR